MRLSSEFKCNFNGELYIRGYKVLELLAKTIEENGAGKKGLNLEASKKFMMRLILVKCKITTIRI